MSRARHALSAAASAAVLVIGGALVWWVPTLAVRLARLVGLRLFHIAELALVDLLFAVRRDRAARCVLAASIWRNRRALRAGRRRLQEAETRRAR